MFLKKLKIELPYDQAIPLLGIYPEKNMVWKDACTPVFISALYTIAKPGKQPKCPSTDEWIKKMWYIYTMEYYSAMRKNEIMPCAATWMDREIIILSEVRRRKTNTIWYHLYVESKILYKSTYLQSKKQTYSYREQTCCWQGAGRVEERIGSLGLAEANYYV